MDMCVCLCVCVGVSWKHQSGRERRQLTCVCVCVCVCVCMHVDITPLFSTSPLPDSLPLSSLPPQGDSYSSGWRCHINYLNFCFVLWPSKPKLLLFSGTVYVYVFLYIVYISYLCYCLWCCCYLYRLDCSSH